MKKNKPQSLLTKISKISVNRMSGKDLVFFIKRLSFLIKAGIPVLDSLQMIREQTRGKVYGRMLDTVIDDVSNGQYLSTSLSRYKNMFGEFSINIIGFGESTGILSDNLEYLADELKKRQTLRKKVIGAFIYPAIVTLATFGITAFLMIYLFPKILPVFSSIHMELPLSTRIVMFLSNSIINYGLIGLGIIFIFVITFVVTLKRSKKFHFYFDKFLLKTPILGTTLQYYNLANCTRTMGLLLKSGITISDALPIVVKTTVNLVYKKEFDNLSRIVSKGEKMSNYLKSRRTIFPDVISQIISVGERSGNLENSLVYLSEMYEAEVDDFTKNLSGLIEPILMIFMGILVGFIAISIITPIYGITQHLQPK
ncbi:MAG: type II secretion system F family protein [Minisyncoccia bacterium]